MAGLVPAIHVLLCCNTRTWMPGTRPSMTVERFVLVFAMDLAAWR
jgi:hypothetical protein